MSKKNHKQVEGKETVEFFQDLDREALQSEKFIEKHASKIAIAFGVIVLGILAYFGYQQFVVAPKNTEAMKSYTVAQKYLKDGKEVEALGGKSEANPGFIGIAKKYAGTPTAEMSAYNAAILKFKEGKYQETIDLLEKFSSDNETLMALKFGAMADAKSNLKRNNEAVELLEKAIKASNDPYTQYYFTKKAGMLALAMDKKAEAKKYFTTIDEKYEEYDNGMSDAYIEMVKNY
ncbi:MAG: hypothetical protein CSA38_05575 [Flavobacteriales bacterium]|nr:MAG: hypothetical protein CSA38_05575 [Flavobacteriales bacterium]